jgi:L-ribulose-5-phosphate 3-epimerase UlaE
VNVLATKKMQDESRIMDINLRVFLASTVATGAAVAVDMVHAAAETRPRIPLGFDNFAVRAMKWNARQLVDHAVSLGCTSVFITDFGPFEGRLDDTVEVLKAGRSRALDAGVKIAVENHAGDMQSRELKQLVEAAGPEFVGVNFDSGNACWTLEDPVRALATLAPYVLTTSLRDTMVWESREGVTAQWTAMGEGCVDFPSFFKLFAERCPGVTVHIETISGFPRTFPIYQEDFWRQFPTARAENLAAFLALAQRGKPIAPFKPPKEGKAEAEQQYQLAELDRSIRYCKDVLGLGA